MKILVAPLDWGLGHATRTIPVIRGFLAHGATVDLAVSGNISALYRGEFPDLTQIEVPGYEIRYPNRGFEMPFWLLKNYRRIMRTIREEHGTAESLAFERGYDMIFSDNRFGFYSNRAKNIYMTHQLRIAFPGPFSAFENIGIAWHRKQMEKFDEIWVPDYAKFPGLGGRLSHVNPSALKLSKPIRFVGPLSRFDENFPVGVPKNSVQRKYRFLAILSGPEPMRSLFEKKIFEALSRISGKHAVILGKPGEKKVPETPSNMDVFNHLETADFARMVQSSDVILSRPGYSTVMDMATLGAKCVFVPTPGQTEQEFLGEELFRAGFSGLLKQRELSPMNLCEMERKTHVLRNSVSRPNPLLSAVDSLFKEK